MGLFNDGRRYIECLVQKQGPWPQAAVVRKGPGASLPFSPFHVPVNHSECSEGYECLDKKTDSKLLLPPRKRPAWQQRDVEPQSHNGNVWSGIVLPEVRGKSPDSQTCPGLCFSTLLETCLNIRLRDMLQ